MNAQAEMKKSRFGHGVNSPTALTTNAVVLPPQFGRMFANLPPHETTDAALPAGDVAAINSKMAVVGDAGGVMDESTAPAPIGDSAVPAGYTFLGQFIDHDITFDPVSRLTDTITLVNGRHNFRTPGLDLDSVYGGPPDVPCPALFPYLYVQKTDHEGELLVGAASQSKRLFPDLPRNEENTALIGDMRNDENLVVSQLHTAFLHFHNQIVARLRADGHTTLLYEKARAVVTWYYHKMICEDFLPRIIGQNMLDALLLPNGSVFFPIGMTHMPIEFSVAAYRYGHSQVRETYRFNTDTTPANIFERGATAQRKPETYVHWRYFFDLGPGYPNAQRGRPIDMRLPPALLTLPISFSANGEPRSLATRNLQRGRVYGLPSGQTVATAMAANPAIPGPVPVLPLPAGWPAAHMGEMPLWTYILHEAQQLGDGGNHLGPVGGRIVGEVILGFMRNNANSCLNLPNPPHGIDLPNRDSFSMPDLLRVAYPQPDPEVAYTVKHRDTLSRIARRFGTTVQAILAHNPQITNPDLIFVGQQIVIPVRPNDLIWPLE